LLFHKNSRKGGAGPAEGITIFWDKVQATVPTQSGYVRRSPFALHKDNGKFILIKNGKQLLNVDLPTSPQFYNLKTKDDVPYKKIALLHGKDCLASTIYQDCIYWNSDLRCKFCGIRLSLEAGKTIKEKTESQLAEVAMKAEELDKINHVTLTTGTMNLRDKGTKKLAQCVAAIKKKSSLPIHVQFEPPSEMKFLEELAESGVDTVGIHIESFDSKVLSYMAPAKAKIGMERFRKTWQRAVEIFGKNQVSSFVIVGLGEKPAKIIEGSELLARMGVYPFVVPLRPIPHTFLEEFPPPSAEVLIYIYKKVAEILKKHNLSYRNSKAGCVRCGACSALPEFEFND